MGVFDNYPYTNYHELNLDWIVQDMLKLNSAYDGLQKEIQETIDYINNFESHADELIAQQVEVYLSYYTQQLNTLKSQLTALENLINNEIFTQLNLIDNEIDSIKADIKDFKFLINQKILSLEELMHEYKHDIDNIIDGKTQELEQYIIEHVTKLDRLDVVNPITGIFENIQNVLNDIAAIVTKSYGITAGQYDSLQLTASRYDSYLLTAYQYSTQGYFELYLKLTVSLMRSPFTGLITTIEEVVTQLSELHKCALTAAEYDALQITAEDYDFMQISAFGYDWFGFKIVSPITAQKYDELQLTSAQYDSKEITAVMYGRGMRVLLDNQISTHGTCGDYLLLANQITQMQAEISELSREVEIAQLKVGAGVTYVGVCEKGETECRVDIPTILPDDRILINSNKNTLPIKVEVIPLSGIVFTWKENATVDDSLAFTVNVSNKIN